MQPDVIETLVLVLHVLGSLAIIGLILIQHGKGADAGAGFGSGSSGTVFGSGGAGNFLTKTTTTITIVFFLTSFALAYFAKEKSVAVRNLGIPEVVQEAPVADIPALDEDAANAASSELPEVDTDLENSTGSEVPQG